MPGPTGGRGRVTKVEAVGARVEEAADIAGPEIEVNALPGLAAIEPHQDPEVEPWYPHAINAH